MFAEKSGQVHGVGNRGGGCLSGPLRHIWKINVVGSSHRFSHEYGDCGAEAVKQTSAKPCASSAVTSCAPSSFLTVAMTSTRPNVTRRLVSSVSLRMI